MNNKIFKKLIKEIKVNWLEYLILFIVLYLAYIYQLGAANIRTWDEGVYGSNVLEMLFRKDFIVKYFDGHYETWATIPPFIAWFQVLSFTICGLNEFAFRLPSAVAAIIISFTIFYFLNKEFKDKYWGIFSALILAFCNGFVTYHVARTGDLDIFVTLFSTLYVITFYKFYLSEFKSKRLAFYFVLFIFCAFWSKLIAGFFYLPVIFFFVLFSGKTKAFFKNKWLYISGFIFLFITSLFYFYMETKVSGYTKIALHNGVIGRFTGTLSDNHIEPFWFYWINIKSYNFLPWLYMMPLSILLVFIDRNAKRKYFFIFLISLVLFYWLVISTSVNKLNWYDGQLYPFLSIIVAYSFSVIFNSIVAYFNLNRFLRQLLFLFFFIAFMGNMLLETEKRNLNERHLSNFDELYGSVLKKINKQYPEIKSICILHPNFSPHVVYYKTLYNLYYNYNISEILIENYIKLDPDSYILYEHPNVTEKLKRFYDYEILYQYKNIQFVHVKKQKKYILSEYNLDGDSLQKNAGYYSADYKTTGNASIKLNKNNSFSSGWSFDLVDLKFELFSKIQISSDVLMKSNKFNSYLVFESSELNYWYGIDLKNIVSKPGVWYKIDTIVELPKFEDWQNPKLKIYFWNNNKDDLFIDNVKLHLIKQ